jgi:hypothetical protein
MIHGSVQISLFSFGHCPEGLQYFFIILAMDPYIPNAVNIA